MGACSQKEAEKAMDAVFAFIAEQMAEGNEVPVFGFGTFARNLRPAREGLNPHTKEKILIEEKYVPAFRAASALKEQVK